MISVQSDRASESDGGTGCSKQELTALAETLLGVSERITAMTVTFDVVRCRPLDLVQTGITREMAGVFRPLPAGLLIDVIHKTASTISTKCDSSRIAAALCFAKILQTGPLDFRGPSDAVLAPFSIGGLLDCCRAPRPPPGGTSVSRCFVQAQTQVVQTIVERALKTLDATAYEQMWGGLVESGVIAVPVCFPASGPPGEDVSPDTGFCAQAATDLVVATAGALALKLSRGVDQGTARRGFRELAASIVHGRARMSLRLRSLLTAPRAPGSHGATLPQLVWQKLDHLADEAKATDKTIAEFLQHWKRCVALFAEVSALDAISAAEELGSGWGHLSTSPSPIPPRTLSHTHTKHPFTRTARTTRRTARTT